ncbi:MAG: hypothetical protein ACTSVY_08630 [Candidatus Helarchaeota archaeon]
MNESEGFNYYESWINEGKPEYRIIFLDSKLNPSQYKNIKKTKIKKALEEMKNNEDNRFKSVLKYLRRTKIIIDLKENGVTLYRDRFMTFEVLHLLKKIKKNEKLNLIEYIIKQLRKNPREIYNELKKIHFIGDKLVTFLLRDVIDFFDVKGDLRNNILILPVDTWEKQVIEMVFKEVFTESRIKRKIIDTCKKNNLDSLTVNEGIWIFGSIIGGKIINEIMLLSDQEFKRFEKSFCEILENYLKFIEARKLLKTNLKNIDY